MHEGQTAAPKVANQRHITAKVSVSLLDLLAAHTHRLAPSGTGGGHHFGFFLFGFLGFFVAARFIAFGHYIFLWIALPHDTCRAGRHPLGYQGCLTAAVRAMILGRSARQALSGVLRVFSACDAIVQPPLQQGVINDPAKE